MKGKHSECTGRQSPLLCRLGRHLQLIDQVWRGEKCLAYDLSVDSVKICFCVWCELEFWFIENMFEPEGPEETL